MTETHYVFYGDGDGHIIHCCSTSHLFGGVQIETCVEHQRKCIPTYPTLLDGIEQSDRVATQTSLEDTSVLDSFSDDKFVVNLHIVHPL